MFKAVSDITDCLKEAKKATSIGELIPVMMLLEPLESAIDNFIEEKLKPIHDAIQRGEDPFAEKKEESDEKPTIDWDAILRNMKPGGNS